MIEKSATLDALPRAAASERHDEIARVARDVFGWEHLRPGQAEAIDTVVSGRDVLAVMATGFGKSAIYQVAGHLIDGPTVVVSPLIALQVDQVRHIMKSTGTNEAVAVNSSQSARRNEMAWDAIRSKEAEFIFLSPEQLSRADVIDRLAQEQIGLFVVDEAHSVSAWGHDFRPDYLHLGAAAQSVNAERILALTASGSPPVRREIVRRLGMRAPVEIVRGFDRPNIHLTVVRHEKETEKNADVIAQAAQLAKPGLVYASTRRNAERVARDLDTRGVRAAAYHAGLTMRRRTETYESFLADEVDALGATSAFGMGVDKPNVRFVLHSDVTDSLDSYYQEIGRAGRDGQNAVAALHYRPSDLAVHRFFNSAQPSAARITRIFDTLIHERCTATRQQIEEDSGLPHRVVGTILNLLLDAGVVEESSGTIQCATSAKNADIASVVQRVIDQHRDIEESRLAMMRNYAETLRCRRQFLLSYFGEALPEPCGNCDTCDSGTSWTYQEANAPSEGVYGIGTPVHHAAWGDGTVVRTEGDKVTVFFAAAGYRTLSMNFVREHDLLTVDDAS